MTYKTMYSLAFLFFFYSLKCSLAQEITSTEETAKISVGLHAGLAFSTVNSSQLAFPISQTQLTLFDQKPLINGRVGIQILGHLGKKYGIETGVFYEKRGVKTIGAYDPATNTVDRDDDAVTRYTYEYFTVPLLFKILFKTEGRTQFSLHLGPYFSFLQTATYSYKTIDIFSNPDGSFYESIREEAFQVDHLTRDKDIGLRLRLGAERKITDLATLFTYGFYSQGLTHIEDFVTPNPSEISDGRHTYLGLTIGAYFKML